MLKYLVDANDPKFQDQVVKKIFDRLTIIAMHRKTERNMDRGKDCLQEYSASPNPEWQGKFFQLLLEVIRRWGKGKTDTGAKLPSRYFELYKTLLAQKVYFPVQDEYLDIPPQLLSNSIVQDAQQPENPGLVPASIERVNPHPNTVVEVSPMVAKDLGRERSFVEKSLVELSGMRQILVETCLSNPLDESRIGSFRLGDVQ